MQISNDLSITIFGKAGAGKSTVALLIQETLNRAGINAVVNSEDTAIEPLLNNQQDRLSKLAEKLNGQAVEINQTQLRRTALAEESPLDREARILTAAARTRGELTLAPYMPHALTAAAPGAVAKEDELSKDVLATAITNAVKDQA